MYQRVVITGNLEDDPEVDYPEGGPVARFNVTVNGGGVFHVAAWNSLAEVCRSWRKGQRVVVEGCIGGSPSGVRAQAVRLL